MRKLLLSVTFIMLISNIKAQGFGVQLGYNFANVSVSGLDLLDYEEINSVGGINFGVNYDIEVSENFFIEPGILYSQKGFEYFAEDGGYDLGTDFILDVTFNYLDIPVYAKYIYEVGDGLYLYGKFGLSYSIALNGEYTMDNGIETETDDIEFGDDEDFKSSDLGINIGAGVKINKFEVGINYFSGSDIYNDDDDEVSNRVFSINLTYRFSDF